MTNPAAPARANSYGALWRRVPRELGFLLLGFPISLAGFVLTVALFSSGAGTLAAFLVGIFLIIAALYVSRGFGALEITRLEWAGQPAIKRPDWQDARAGTGFVGWLRALFGNGHYWLYLLHTMVINFAVALFTWTVTVVWVSIGLGGVTYWFWNLFIPRDDQDWYFSEWLFANWRGPVPDINFDAVDPIAYFLLGAIFLATLPFVTRGLVLLHYAIARGVLGAFRSDALQREVATLSESRGAAISAEGHSLRRLERDIHDGPQQRLVRLQMDLAAAGRQLDEDPQKARTLIDEAMVQSREALEELRALSRGFAPPILMDRGLIAALESAAARSAVPARVVSQLSPDTALPQEIERNAYFVASEALVNAAKHAEATSIDVRVGLRRIPDADETWLDVVVTDNGIGGAKAVDGHGIAGLEERLRGLGGALELSSPAGGPTIVMAHLPVTASVSSRTTVAAP